jgi:hypothetical protein
MRLPIVLNHDVSETQSLEPQLMRKLAIAALVLTSIAAVAEAARRGGGGQVVHSRRAPVVLHRALPPYTGVHVYQGKR